MIPSIVPRYAAALAVLFLLLSVRVIRARRAARLAIGTGDDRELLRRSRVHANFAEYAPMAVLMLLMAELRGAPAPVLHSLCLALLAGRAVHAWGVSRTPENLRFRVTGMITTLTVIGLTALLLLL